MGNCFKKSNTPEVIIFPLDLIVEISQYLSDVNDLFSLYEAVAVKELHPEIIDRIMYSRSQPNCKFRLKANVNLPPTERKFVKVLEIANFSKGELLEYCKKNNIRIPPPQKNKKIGDFFSSFMKVILTKFPQLERLFIFIDDNPMDYLPLNGRVQVSHFRFQNLVQNLKVLHIGIGSHSIIFLDKYEKLEELFLIEELNKRDMKNVSDLDMFYEANQSLSKIKIENISDKFPKLLRLKVVGNVLIANISELEHLQHLFLSSTKMRRFSKDKYPIKNFKGLKRLELDSFSVPYFGIQESESLEYLKIDRFGDYFCKLYPNVDLKDRIVPRKALFPLKTQFDFFYTFPKLRELELILARTGYFGSKLIDLNISLPSLEKFVSVYVTRNIKLYINEMPLLKKIEVINCSRVGFKYLEENEFNLSEIEEIMISDTDCGERMQLAIPRLPKLRKLKMFSLSSTSNYNYRGLEFKDHQDLEYLFCNNEISSLKNLPSLICANFTTGFTKKNQNFKIQNCPALRKLILAFNWKKQREEEEEEEEKLLSSMIKKKIEEIEEIVFSNRSIEYLGVIIDEKEYVVEKEYVGIGNIVFDCSKMKSIRELDVENYKTLKFDGKKKSNLESFSSSPCGGCVNLSSHPKLVNFTWEGKCTNTISIISCKELKRIQIKFTNKEFRFNHMV